MSKAVTHATLVPAADLKQPAKRITYIDVARGIAIVLMIVGHLMNRDWKYGLIYSFHMPLFLIVSGFFFKEKSLRKEAHSLFKKLLLPTIVIIFTIQVINTTPILGIGKAVLDALKTVSIGWILQDKIAFDFPSVGSLWFIYLLIVVRLIFLINKKITKENDLLLGLIVTLEAYLGFLAGQFGYWLPWSLDVACVCLLLYFVGYLLKKYHFLEIIMRNWYYLVPCLIIWLIGAYFNWIELANRSYPNGIWSLITAICGSLIVIKISQLIEKYLKAIARLLSWCGKNSLYVLFGHFIETGLIIYPIVDTVQIIGRVELVCFKIIFAISIGAGIIIFTQLLSSKPEKRI